MTTLEECYGHWGFSILPLEGFEERAQECPHRHDPDVGQLAPSLDPSCRLFTHDPVWALVSGAAALTEASRALAKSPVETLNFSWRFKPHAKLPLDSFITNPAGSFMSVVEDRLEGHLKANQPFLEYYLGHPIYTASEPALLFRKDGWPDPALRMARAFYQALDERLLLVPRGSVIVHQAGKARTRLFANAEVQDMASLQRDDDMEVFDTLKTLTRDMDSFQDALSASRALR